jgi:hypothetical protein
MPREATEGTEGREETRRNRGTETNRALTPWSVWQLSVETTKPATRATDRQHTRRIGVCTGGLQRPRPALQAITWRTGRSARRPGSRAPRADVPCVRWRVAEGDPGRSSSRAMRRRVVFVRFVKNLRGCPRCPENIASASGVSRGIAAATPVARRYGRCAGRRLRVLREKSSRLPAVSGEHRQRFWHLDGDRCSDCGLRGRPSPGARTVPHEALVHVSLVRTVGASGGGSPKATPVARRHGRCAGGRLRVLREKSSWLPAVSGEHRQRFWRLEGTRCGDRGRSSSRAMCRKVVFVCFVKNLRG